jgi:hypothetical protein
VFKRPVPIGTTIRVEAEVGDMRALDQAQGLVTIALRIRDVDGPLLARCAIEALWRRDRAPANPNGSGPAAANASNELSPVSDGRVLV